MRLVEEPGETGSGSRAVRWAIVYTVASVVVGPTIAALGFVLFTQGNGDLCDGGSVWPSVAVRDAAFQRAETFQTTSAVVMLTVGTALLAGLGIAVLRRPRTGRATVAAVGVLVMMAGYGLVIATSGAGGQVC